MKKGRLVLEEKNRRIRRLLRFIYTFRYVTRKQVDRFIRLSDNLVSSQWSIKRAVNNGLINVYYDSTFKTKIYYLTKKGKETIRGEEAYIKQYHFEKRHAGTNTFDHHNMLVDTYFILRRQLDIKSWQCEWSQVSGLRRQDLSSCS